MTTQEALDTVRQLQRQYQAAAHLEDVIRIVHESELSVEQREAAVGIAEARLHGATREADHAEEVLKHKQQTLMEIQRQIADAAKERTLVETNVQREYQAARKEAEANHKRALDALTQEYEEDLLSKRRLLEGMDHEIEKRQEVLERIEVRIEELRKSLGG